MSKLKTNSYLCTTPLHAAFIAWSGKALLFHNARSYRVDQHIAIISQEYSDYLKHSFIYCFHISVT
jgi:uncharacterized membrane protein YjjP (DUF1212 family)